MEDNFYQVSSERLIKPPKAQSDKLKKDRISFEHERPLITEVVKHIEKQISDREKVDFIKNKTDAEKFMREVDVNKQVCDILRHELSIIQTAIKKFDKEVKPEDE